jgi:hypothetical protein
VHSHLRQPPSTSSFTFVQARSHCFSAFSAIRVIGPFPSQLPTDWSVTCPILVHTLGSQLSAPWLTSFERSAFSRTPVESSGDGTDGYRHRLRTQEYWECWADVMEDGDVGSAERLWGWRLGAKHWKRAGRGGMILSEFGIALLIGGCDWLLCYYLTLGCVREESRKREIEEDA